MKRILPLALLMLWTVMAEARSLVITLTDGVKVYYPISKSYRPVLRFADGVMRVDAQSYAFAGIRDMRISEEDAPTGIRSVESLVKLGEDQVWIDSEMDVAVYDAQGRKQSVDIVKTGGGQIVSLESLPRGLYVVQAGKTTFKITKK